MEKDIIYIAGNPNAYPLEYYSPGAQCYQGVIPELLNRFSEQSRYDVRYYAPDQGDRREALAASRQVDLISSPEHAGTALLWGGRWNKRSSCCENTGRPAKYSSRYSRSATISFDCRTSTVL